jgi:hypothetical protein
MRRKRDQTVQLGVGGWLDGYREVCEGERERDGNTSLGATVEKQMLGGGTLPFRGLQPGKVVENF